MGKLSDEEQKLLDELTAKQSASDDDADFEVEFWSEGADGTRHGGRVPWSVGKKIYGKTFPDLFGEKPTESEPEGTEKPSKGTPSQRYFGKS